MTKPFVLLILLLCPAIAFSNAGVFSGSGHTVKLISTDQIQLIQEKVLITGVVRSIEQGINKGKAYIAKYKCEFRLKNLTDGSPEIQIGFPLNAQFFESPYPPETGREMAKEFYFKAMTADGDMYQTEWRPRDEENKFSSIFLWKMPFAPNQTIDLVVEYQMPFSLGLGSTERSLKRYYKPWYSELAFSVPTGFSYVTETGKSWKGPIEMASFEIDLKDVEQDLRTYGIHMGAPDLRSEQIKELLQGLYRDVTPKGWTDNNETLKWDLTNYSPSEPFRVMYFPIGIPSTVEHCKIVVAKLLGASPTTEDLMDFREIVAAFYGQESNTPRVKEFVENQVWFPTAQKNLDPGKNVLVYLDSLVEKSKQAT